MTKKIIKYLREQVYFWIGKTCHALSQSFLIFIIFFQSLRRGNSFSVEFMGKECMCFQSIDFFSDRLKMIFH